MSDQQIIDTWIKLPKSSKKVFMKIHKLDKKYKGDVFFEVNNLVIWTGFSRRSVFYALKKLRSIGWISHLNRPYQCNIYFIWEVLKRYKFTFSRVKIAPNLHPIDYSQNIRPSYVQQPSPAAPIPPSAVTAPPDVPKSEDQDKRKKNFYALPEWLQIKCMWEKFDFGRYGWILKKLTEREFSELKNDVLWYISGNKIDKPERFIFKMAHLIYKKRKLCNSN